MQDEQAVTALCQSLSMTVGHAADGQHTLVDGRDVTASSARRKSAWRRPPSPSTRACAPGNGRAPAPALRQETPCWWWPRYWHACADERAVKIFLTASAEERARRRYQEMRNKGMDANFDDVLRDLRARDEQDTHRAVDPLRAAEDAVTVDSTSLTFDEVVEAILRIVADKTGGAQA